MKKFFLIPVLVVMLGSFVYADNGGKGANRVSSAVSRQFTADFSDAQDVTWTVTGDFQKADFAINGEKMSAFYKFNGEYMGLTHRLDVTAIPAKTMKLINEQYQGYTVGEVIVYQTNEALNPDLDPVSYFVDLKKDNSELLLRVTSTADIEFFKQIK